MARDFQHASEVKPDEEKSSQRDLIQWLENYKNLATLEERDSDELKLLLLRLPRKEFSELAGNEIKVIIDLFKIFVLFRGYRNRENLKLADKSAFEQQVMNPLRNTLPEHMRQVVDFLEERELLVVREGWEAVCDRELLETFLFHYVCQKIKSNLIANHSNLLSSFKALLKRKNDSVQILKSVIYKDCHFPQSQVNYPELIQFLFETRDYHCQWGGGSSAKSFFHPGMAVAMLCGGEFAAVLSLTVGEKIEFAKKCDENTSLWMLVDTLIGLCRCFGSELFQEYNQLIFLHEDLDSVLRVADCLAPFVPQLPASFDRRGYVKTLFERRDIEALAAALGEMLGSSMDLEDSPPKLALTQEEIETIFSHPKIGLVADVLSAMKPQESQTPNFLMRGLTFLATHTPEKELKLDVTSVDRDFKMISLTHDLLDSILTLARKDPDNLAKAFEGAPQKFHRRQKSREILSFGTLFHSSSERQEQEHEEELLSAKEENQLLAKLDQLDQAERDLDNGPGHH